MNSLECGGLAPLWPDVPKRVDHGLISMTHGEAKALPGKRTPNQYVWCGFVALWSAAARRRFGLTFQKD